jgi:ribosomal protein S18 acetylase RimI-like enzyme
LVRGRPRPDPRRARSDARRGQAGDSRRARGGSVLTLALRPYRPGDADAAERIIVAAWAQYRGDFADWPAFEARLRDLDTLSGQVDLIVAERGGRLVGLVGYGGPGRAKAAIFPRDWAVIRMLSVPPGARGLGVGRLLSEACIARAAADGAAAIGLHTSPIMAQAVELYRRLGFAFHRDLPEMMNVPYRLYCKPLR